ncbi:hypothetical protein BSNK01_20360 [Bacillaceae bacterium]
MMKTYAKKKLFNVFLIVTIYLNIILIFAIIYLLLDYFQLGPIIDHYASGTHQSHWYDRVTRTIYFSAITLFSTGYGDVTPFGWSKAVAIVEAMVGYTFPAALILQFVRGTETHASKEEIRKEAKAN